MVNRREKEVAEKYEDGGWSPVRCGAPDWLMVKTGNGEIEDVKFVEVKNPNGSLSYEQKVWRKVIEKLGGEFVVEIVE